MSHSSDLILITVNTLIGTSFSILAGITETIGNLKERIALQEGVDPASQHILLYSKELSDHERLIDTGLYHGAHVTLVLSMKVGPLKTESVQLDIDEGIDLFNFCEEDEDDDGVQLLLLRVNGQLYVHPTAKCKKFNLENMPMPPLRKIEPKWNRERFCENAITKEKLNILRRTMELKKKLKTKAEGVQRPPSSSIRLKTPRKTPRKPIRSSNYENALSSIRLIKAEILLQSKRNRTPGKLPYTHSQLAQYTRARFVILVEEQRMAAGEAIDYIPRPKSVIPTVLTRSMRSAMFSTSEDSSSSKSNYSTMALAPRRRPVPRNKIEENVPKLVVYQQECSLPSINGKVSRPELTARICNISSSRLSTARLPLILERPESNIKSSRLSTTQGPQVSKKHKASTKSNVRRCAQCRKKLSVVNEYECRCGQFFCSKHRYAESHSCTFDYKAEGRRILTEANPVIQAPKVPQI